MASETLRDIRKHIKSVETTGKVASAMKTISSAKYYKLSGMNTDFSRYADTCTEILASIGDPYTGRTESGRSCFVLFTGNRGLCGSYNAVIISRFLRIIRNEREPFIVTVGKKGASYLESKGIHTEKHFAFGDVPVYEDGAALADYLDGLYSSGTVDRVVFVYQKFKNLLVQTPVSEVFLPVEKTLEKDDYELETATNSLDKMSGGTGNGVFSGTENEERVYYPSVSAVKNTIYSRCLRAKAYSSLIGYSVGAEAAVMTAMRTASDNATELMASLELKLNRKRQSQVTAGVIETSGSNIN